MDKTTRSRRLSEAGWKSSPGRPYTTPPNGSASDTTAADGASRRRRRRTGGMRSLWMEAMPTCGRTSRTAESRRYGGGARRLTRNRYGGATRRGPDRGSCCCLLSAARDQASRPGTSAPIWPRPCQLPAVTNARRRPSCRSSGGAYAPIQRGVSGHKTNEARDGRPFR